MGTVLDDNMSSWGHSEMLSLGNVPGTPGSYRKLYQENLDLKAKISRLENPDAPQYTEEEIEAMCSEEHVSSEALAAMCSEESGMD